MSAISLIKGLIPRSVKQFIKKFTRRERILSTVSSNLPHCVCIDVGASYFPHYKWDLFLRSRNTHWIAVEPNESNIGYLKTWAFPSTVKAITTGLSSEGGIKTLYLTNVDSGSSLLEPIITVSMQHRIKEKIITYLYPMRTIEVNTITLADVIDQENPGFPVFVKLDTQGTELSILRGANKQFLEHRIVGIEMESTLLAQPIMQGSGKFWEACQYLEKMGFELLDIFPISGVTNLDVKSPKGNRYLTECDAVFALRRDVAKVLPVNFRIGLFAFYLTNRLFEEAFAILEDDVEVREHFSSRKGDLEDLKRLIIHLA